MAIVGIDLGTTNSAVAVYRDGNVLTIPNSVGEYLTPSAASEIGGEIVVGAIAKERLVTHPELTASLFKRTIGQPQKYSLGKNALSAHELSALVLRELKADAEDHLGECITSAVVSVPAYFTDPQRKATIEAANLAGLDVLRIINEPTAAAIAYGIQERPDGCRFIVLDIGGGTFDVSLMEYFDGVLEVHATAGDSFLGGEDFTDALVDYFLTENDKSRKSISRSDLQRIRKACEQGKRQLDGRREVVIEASGYTPATVTPTTEQELFSPLLQRIMNPITRALSDSSTSEEDLDDVILVGGATRMHSFRAAVARLFRRMPSVHLDPDLVVAHGAAIQAALSARDSALEDVVLTDVCPHSLGTEVFNESDRTGQRGYFLPIIERNTTVPASVVKTVTTIHDDQDKILVKIYQGESRYAGNNLYLGELEVEVPKAPAGHQPVDIRYSYDSNGILEIDVNVISTGAQANMVIENGSQNLTDEDRKRSLEVLGQLKFHPRDDQPNRLILAKGARLYESSLGDLRTYVGEIMAEFEVALESQDENIIRAARKRAQDLLESVEREAP